MKIQKINKDKVRVIFDYKELEESEISVQSFLSGSPEAKKLIESIISVVNEDLNFGSKVDEIRYDLISFSNKVFIIILTKQKATKRKNSADYILYQFNSLEELLSFIDLVNKYIDFNMCSEYNLKNKYYIKLDLSNKDFSWKKSFVASLSEFKNPILLDNISNAYFEERAQKINR